MNDFLEYFRIKQRQKPEEKVLNTSIIVELLTLSINVCKGEVGRTEVLGPDIKELGWYVTWLRSRDINNLAQRSGLWCFQMHCILALLIPAAEKKGEGSLQMGWYMQKLKFVRMGVDECDQRKVKH